MVKYSIFSKSSYSIFGFALNLALGNMVEILSTKTFNYLGLNLFLGVPSLSWWYSTKASTSFKSSIGVHFHLERPWESSVFESISKKTNHNITKILTNKMGSW